MKMGGGGGEGRKRLQTNPYPGYQRFFLARTRSFVGHRPTRIRPKAEDPKPETAHEKPLEPRVTNPSILKTCVRQRTQRLIGSAIRTMLTCVDQRFISY